jgi:hypothetical protein
MGTFAEPAIVDDRFSFLLTKENKLPFSISVCGCQPDSCGKRPKKIYKKNSGVILQPKNYLLRKNGQTIYIYILCRAKLQLIRY